MTDKIIVGLYVRVSTQEQVQEGFSLGEQTERLRKYSEAQNWIVHRVYTDPGFSGAKIDRPALQSLIMDVSEGKLDKVLVYKLDRLSRSQKDTLYLIEDVFLKNGVDFVSMTENFDTGTPLGRAMIGILSVFAQLEREQIKERMAIGREGRAKSGLYTGNNRAPTGYDYIDGQLVLNPYYAEMVKRIFKEFLQGSSLTSIAKRLNEDGLLSIVGNKWCSITVRQVLVNPVYTGKVKFSGAVYPGVHEPIIDEETYDRAAALLEERKTDSAKYLHFSEKSSIVTGLCWCSHCKAKKVITTGCRKNDGSFKKFVVCKNKNEKGCPDIRVPLTLVEETVLDEIRKLRLDPEVLKKNRSTSPAAALSDQIHIYEDKIAANDKKIRRLTDLYVVEGIDLTDLKEQIERYSNENIMNRKRINQLKRSQIEKKDEEEIVSLAALIDDADPEIVKSAVQALIKRIDFSGNSITIIWNF